MKTTALLHGHPQGENVIDGRAVSMEARLMLREGWFYITPRMLEQYPRHNLYYSVNHGNGAVGRDRFLVLVWLEARKEHRDLPVRGICWVEGCPSAGGGWRPPLGPLAAVAFER